MSPDSGRGLKNVPTRVPRPQALRQHGASQAHVNTAITMMGLVMGLAAYLGVRSAGRSLSFRGAILGFGSHGFGHLAISAIA